MSCSVAITSPSPAFSPSPRIPHYSLDGSQSPSAASCSSSSSPFRQRLPAAAAAAATGGLRPSLNLEICASPPAAAIAPKGGSQLKRKRPTRIDIPVAAEALRLSAEGSEKEEQGDRFSAFCKRGRNRIEIEDRFSADTQLLGDPRMAFFGVFDGHGGSRAAEFASENLVRRIEEAVEAASGGDGVEEAVRAGYLRTDEEFSKEVLGGGGGACCVTALIRGGELVVSNAGDCRAVLCRGGVAEALTSDHRPSRDDERLRIESLGGFVELRRGVWRLQGCLAVSRGIGDGHLKPWVVAEPETMTVAIEPDCEFLILASDGLWDKVGNQEAVDVARQLIGGSDDVSWAPERKKKAAAAAAMSACKKLAGLSTARGSFDDITVMIVLLN